MGLNIRIRHISEEGMNKNEGKKKKNYGVKTMNYFMQIY
jgi:hypothetical protein